jgi:CBS domain-containing protein
MVTVGELMSSEIVAVEPTATVAEAATVMGSRRVGSVLVIQDGELVGIFTERDVLRAVVSDFDVAGLRVDSAMTRHPRTVTPETPAAEALDLMDEGGFRHLPVLRDDRVVGVVSIRDLTRVARG